jgi:hypothetical protein
MGVPEGPVPSPRAEKESMIVSLADTLVSEIAKDIDALPTAPMGR